MEKRINGTTIAIVAAVGVAAIAAVTVGVVAVVKNKSKD